MDFSVLFLLFLKGILIGFVIAAPVGPIGILCIRRTLFGRYKLALLTGLGAGLADTFYGAVAGFSLVSIADFISTYNFYLRLFGGLLVAWIGFSIFKAPLCQSKEKSGEEDTFFHALTSGFFLTLSNPVTFLIFAAAFAAMGVAPLNNSFVQAAFLVAGVFVGANSWWFSLITTVHLMRHKLSERHLFWINRTSGVILVGFALYIVLSLV
jgi:threonine/homoserine/homoserine lactone efflux protein